MTFQNPLKWPAGWERHQGKRRASWTFKATMDVTRKRLYAELEKLGTDSVVVSSHMALRMDGAPRGDVARRAIEDPGVAIYFIRAGRELVMARDVYDNPLDNLHSLCLALEGLRQMERHGGGAIMERAFRGFMALPAQADWRTILGFRPGAAVTLAQVEAAYRGGAKMLHAYAGGDHEDMVKLNAAIAAARKELEA